MTQLEYGIPKISFIPRGTQTLAYPYRIRVHVKTENFVADVGGFNIVQKTGW